MATLGTIRGQLKLDVSQAIAAYAAVRAANAATLYALRGGSLAFLAMGKSMTAVGVGLAAGIGVAINAAAEFEKRLDFFGAVSASTAEQMEAVRQKALELGQATRYSANEIADSFVELGKAGVSAEQIIDGVGLAVANLGAAADIPLAQAAQIITSAVQTYELAAEDAVAVSDRLAGAANASIVEIEDLGVSLKYVGGVANAVSISLDDTITALGILGKAGIRGSTAGTSLRQILVSLTGTSKKASNTLKELGIITEDGTNQFFTAEGKAKSLSEIFQVLSDHTAGLTEAQRLAAFKIIFNNRALSAAAILADAGADGFAAMNAEISKTTAADVAAKRMDNLSGDIEILRGNLETLFIKAGTPFQEFLRGIVQGLTQLVQWFGNLDEGTQKMIFQIIAGAAAFSLLFGAFSLALGFILQVIGFFFRLGSALGMIWKIVKAGVWVFRLLGAAILGTPIGWIILAIMALIAIFVLLWKKNETFRNAMKAAWAAIVEAVKTAWNWFKNLPQWFSDLWSDIKSGVESGWNAIITFFTVTIPTFFSNAWNTIMTGVTNFVNGVISWFQQLPGRISAFAQQMVSNFITFLSNLPYLAGYVLGLVIGTLVRWGIDITLKAAEYAQAIGATIIQFLTNLPQNLANLFQMAKDWSVQKLTEFSVLVYQKSIEIRDAMINFIQELPGKLRDFFERARAWSVEKLSALATAARERAIAIRDGIVNFIRELPGRVATFFEDMKNRAVNAISSMRDRAVELANRLKDGVVNVITNLPSTVSGIFNKAVDAIKGVISRAFNAAKDFASGLWDGFKDGLGIASPSYIEHAMWAITDTLEDETTRMKKQVRTIQNLGNGIRAPEITPAQVDLISNYMEPTVSSLADQLDRYQQLQGSMSSTARAMGATSDARTAAAISMASSGSGQAPVIVQGGDHVVNNNLDVDIDAPQNMDPEQLATHSARRMGYALGSYTTPIPSPVGGPK